MALRGTKSCNHNAKWVLESFPPPWGRRRGNAGAKWCKNHSSQTSPFDAGDSWARPVVGKAGSMRGTTWNVGELWEGVRNMRGCYASKIERPAILPVTILSCRHPRAWPAMETAVSSRAARGAHWRLGGRMKTVQGKPKMQRWPGWVEPCTQWPTASCGRRTHRRPRQTGAKNSFKTCNRH